MLPETIACFCSVIKHLTHDYSRLVGLLKSCNGKYSCQLLLNSSHKYEIARIQHFISNKQKISGPQLRPLVIIVYMASLLCEHCDFDDLRQEKPGKIAPVALHLRPY